jgi:hypothetical protein
MYFLKDFMLCATYGEDVLQSDATYVDLKLCELTNDMAVS